MHAPALTRSRPSRLADLRREWFSSPRADLLAGLVVALALVPEAISFSIIAGVDPKVGLYASFSIAVIIAFAGGRPAMVSAATGAMALVIVSLVRDHGVEYLFAATILAGLIQVALGALGVGRLMRFVPRTVMVGFVNALAILIFLAQLDHVVGKGVAVYVMVALGVAIIVGLPRLTTAVPAPLGNSVRVASLRRTPPTETTVMVVTVIIVVATHNLALGVAGGVLLAAVFFARRVAHVADVTSVLDPADGRIRIYHVTGELFFASTNELLHLFDYTDDIDRAVIDLEDAHVWDTSACAACAALDAVVAKFHAHDIDAELVGLNPHSADLHGRMTGHLVSSH